MNKSIMVFCATALAVLLPMTAMATLGESDASIPADQSKMKASVRVIQRANYRVHEMALPSGTILRQYANADGMVFAVTWSGPTMPDLQQTLGRYFDKYVSNAKTHGANHRQLRFQSADLIVHAVGRMRSFSGEAYLASSMPAGVTVQDLR